MVFVLELAVGDDVRKAIQRIVGEKTVVQPIDEQEPVTFEPVTITIIEPEIKPVETVTSEPVTEDKQTSSKDSEPEPTPSPVKGSGGGGGGGSIFDNSDLLQDFR